MFTLISVLQNYFSEPFVSDGSRAVANNCCLECSWFCFQKPTCFGPLNECLVKLHMLLLRTPTPKVDFVSFSEILSLFASLEQLWQSTLMVQEKKKCFLVLSKALRTPT